MKEKDIEQYLAALEGGWMSEDDLEISDNEEERLEQIHDGEMLLGDVLEEENGEDSQDDEDDPPLVEDELPDHPALEPNLIPTGNVFAGLLDKRKLIWKKRNMEFHESKVTFKGNSDFGPELSQLDSPYACFSYFFNENFMQNIVEQTNLYVTQKNPEKLTTYTVRDLKKFFGVLLYMSVQQFPSVRSYWSPKFGYEPISSVMPNNKFEKMKNYLHFNNNDQHKEIGHPEHDRLFKIRPVIEELNERFSSVPMDQRLSIDEQMCATKVAHFLKQYLPNKPHKWGFKLYVL